MRCNYNFNGKTYVIEEAVINELMDKYDISEPEAVEVYLSDNEVIENDTITELTNKANKNRVLTTIHGIKGEKKERKPREKKENPLKRELISKLFEALSEYPTAKVTNEERSIDLVIEGREFTVNLVEHRPKK
ncbi:MAG: hypothetical protein LIR46_01400 [Bacteroidota bacterium]|nr:hypothetical protein [Bacteroidota bacterium]